MAQDFDYTIPNSPERTLLIFPTTPPENKGLSSAPTIVEDYGESVLRDHQVSIDPKIEESTASLVRGVHHGSNTDPGQYPPTIPMDLDGEDENNDRRDLRQRLLDAMHPDQSNPEKRFLPRGELRRIINFDIVCNEVLRVEQNQSLAEVCATYVCGDPNVPANEKPGDTARKIFAILVLIESVSLVDKFRREGLSDRDLPLHASNGQTKLWSRHKDQSKPVSFFQFEKPTYQMMEFYSKQWWIHVPFIACDKGGKAYEYRLLKGTVMPWTAVEHKSQGGFGTVERICIHPQHHAFQDYKYFALKTPLPGPPEITTFIQETTWFHKMPPDPHAVRLCATMKLGGKDLLLFPWADGGDLRQLWETTKPPTITSPSRDERRRYVRWIANQFLGIVNAMAKFHKRAADPDTNPDEELFGIHSDIKPGNILHFSQETDQSEYGNLKIADFGLARYHREGSRSGKESDLAAAANNTYRSPEHDTDRKMSRKIDIWALGCVFSEFLTWAIRGSDALSVFRKKRTDESRGKASMPEDNFWLKRVQKIAQMAKDIRAVTSSTARREVGFVTESKKSVSNWISNLAKSVTMREQGPLFLVDMLYFVRDRMLAIGREDRASCEDVVGFLKNCIDTNASCEEYWSCDILPSPGIRARRNNSAKKLTRGRTIQAERNKYIRMLMRTRISRPGRNSPVKRLTRTRTKRGGVEISRKFDSENERGAKECEHNTTW